MAKLFEWPLLLVECEAEQRGSLITLSLTIVVISNDFFLSLSVINTHPNGCLRQVVIHNMGGNRLPIWNDKLSVKLIFIAKCYVCVSLFVYFLNQLINL